MVNCCFMLTSHLDSYKYLCGIDFYMSLTSLNESYGCTCILFPLFSLISCVDFFKINCNIKFIIIIIQI